jgi:hypothetical protein
MALQAFDFKIRIYQHFINFNFKYFYRWIDIIGSRDANGKIPVDAIIRKCPEAFLVRALVSMLHTVNG